jgi:DNA replication licensing factor MCM4
MQMLLSNENGQFNLNLDCENLKCFEPAVKLYNLLIRYPQEVIPIMDCAAEAFCQEMYPERDMPDMAIKVRPFNLGRGVNMRNLDPAGICRLKLTAC